MPPPGRCLTLLPYGLPEREDHREICVRILLRIGGDVDRLIDQPANDLERFARYVARIPSLRDEGAVESPIVLLARTSPLPLTVLNARRVLESRVPALRGACFVLFATPDDDPFFREGAERLGVLSGELEESALWLGPDGAPYLVVTPDLTDTTLLDLRMEQLRTHMAKLRRAGGPPTVRPPKA